MRRCFELAARGRGHVAPNPMVGCVVVWHRCYGQWHAERNALSRTGNYAGAVLYVNLEPCAHFGKTPPCVDIIIGQGISRVVCSNDDPNPLVAGRGFQRLAEAGIQVTNHVLQEEGRHLNRRFFTFVERQRPYIILKWAESADGFMAPTTATSAPLADAVSEVPSEAMRPSRMSAAVAIPGAAHSCVHDMSVVSNTGSLDEQCNHQYWISSPKQTILSHRLRTSEAAILVGSETYLKDNPQLTARLFCGHQPVRVLLDRRHRVSTLTDGWLSLDCSSISDVMHSLYQHKIQSLIVEGGRQILDAFIKERFYDEIVVFRSDTLYANGLNAPSIPSDISAQCLHIVPA